jgi:predicted RNA-binding protein (virulence factor B family)
VIIKAMRIGEYQELKIERETRHGLYLSDGESEVLLPQGQIPEDVRSRRTLRVFVYTDSEDRPVATLQRPYAAVGDFAMLSVVSVEPTGAFLDWGIDKDVFCPIREQQRPMREKERYLVRVYLDEVSQRVVCTSRIGRFLKSSGEELEQGQKVKIIVSDINPEFMSVIINKRIKGTIFRDEWIQDLAIGDSRDAYVKQIRPGDFKVAISLRPQGYEAVVGEREKVLNALKANQGFLPVSDKSTPNEIQKRFGLSKGAFKKILGALYKEGIIEIEARSIRLKKYGD